MEALDEGESRAQEIKIGKTTLYEWQKRRKETGDFQSKKPGRADKITDWNVFTKFARWQNSVRDAGAISVDKRALKNIGFTRSTDIKKEMKKSELNFQRL
ncbi:Transposase [Wolbachia endosymbiont of Cylisticus convexus]|nr:Transposase [Wolbachia endosymbiont of Cylisticus convexus]